MEEGRGSVGPKLQLGPQNYFSGAGAVYYTLVNFVLPIYDEMNLLHCIACSSHNGIFYNE